MRPAVTSYNQDIIINFLYITVMKKVKFFAMLLAAGMLAACSDDLGDAGDMGGNAPDATEGYVRVAIHTPTTTGSMTRTEDGSADLEDGTANEYIINNGVIAFFKADKVNTSPDANAKFVSAYSLNGLTVQGGDGQQVTEKVVTVSKAPKVDKEEQLYALVILNKPSVVEVNETDHSLKLKGTPLTAESTLSAFTTALTDQNLTTYTGDNNDAFTMCNAPLSTEPGTNLGSASSIVAKTLVPVTVYPTQNEAEGNPAARIYVERVVAKVTLKGFNYNNSVYTKDVKNTAGVYDGDVVQLEGWTLNVTNKSTALVRNVSGFSATGWLAAATGTATNKISRFAGTTVIPVDYATPGTNYYRIYWAEDGNYSEKDEQVTDDFTVYSSTAAPEDPQPTWNQNTVDNTDDKDKDYALYCLENTMAADKQNEKQTTSVLLKTIYLTKFEGQAAASQQDFFVCGSSPVKYPKEDITLEGGKKLPGIISFVVEKANDILDTDLTTELSINTNAKAGIYDEKDELKNLFTIADTYLGNEDDVWNAIWSQVGTIRYYDGGISYYYATAIRHFNDDETPWKDGESYGIQHLGRYGVVRNNWYEVNINTISGPGEPEIVQPSGPDDKAEGYIRAEINVLSWAKRSQVVDL